MAAPSTNDAQNREIIDRLASLEKAVTSLSTNTGIAQAQLKDDLIKAMKDLLAQNQVAAKEKKKIATGDAEEKKEPAKKTNLNFPELTDASWNLKKSGDDYEKRLDWFVAVLSKANYADKLHALIGADEVNRIKATPFYAATLAECKKQGDREKSKSFLKALKGTLTAENKWAETSKKLVDYYNEQLAILNQQKIGQLTAEAPGSAEAAAAAALAQSLGATTATPAAQLAAATTTS